jgi:hypothetical protein
MSDERFEHELRSVLLDDAPRDVPDGLRRRVAEVSAADPHQAGRSRSAWPVRLVGTAGLAALIVVLVVGFWRLGPASQPGIGEEPSMSLDRSPVASSPPSSSPSSPSPSASSPSSSPSPSPSVSPSPSGVGVCLAGDLAGQILGWQGAAGSRIADVEITNRNAGRCIVRGTPGLELVDATGRVMIDSTASGPSGEPRVGPTDAAFELAPGGRLRTEVAVSNYCGAAPKLPIDIAFSLPTAGGRLVAKPGSGVASTEATPPCLGSTGSAISMNGWRR